MYEQCLSMIYKLAESGLIHSDFNEYNLMIDDSNKVFYYQQGYNDRFSLDGIYASF